MNKITECLMASEEEYQAGLDWCRSDAQPNSPERTEIRMRLNSARKKAKSLRDLILAKTQAKNNWDHARVKTTVIKWDKFPPEQPIQYPSDETV